ncbi:bifunctional metallophosphatase/5'-nucleotidase [Salinimicrobium sediminilitoris]|uniref:bifunctional metallophosphatase/5'-nucleotidase n=1 Tax=Salinimicrobium sediminilitoris TaxID=2876715 RepID=UPI001E616670|nr:bifunctional UDP-sugar hydrolase/5'-nucleotidase [Salinimicrobium sediminilitoris]MCC8361313.1 bifunctional metallophosphatase/5'-nucleotidase [Salinimicrobium sediminilitoris]
MKTLKLLTIMGFAGLASCGGTAISQEQPQSIHYSTSSEDIITILHTNDRHGTHMPFKTTERNSTSQTGDEGRETLFTFDREAKIEGFPYLATAVKKIRQEKGAENILLLDAGDTFSDDQLGNLTKGEAVIQLMQSLDYDFMALGNHDFDYGKERTAELQEIAGFPFGAANITDSITGKPFLDPPYIIKKVGSSRIAVLAIGYHNTHLTGNRENMKGLRFTPGHEAIKEYIPTLQNQSDILVVLSHAGTAVDKLIAREVDGIDLIIGGHSHDLISPPQKVNGTFIVQALSDGAILGETQLIIKDNRLIDVKTDHHFLWNDEWKPDQETMELVTRLRSPYLDQLEEKIANTETVIGRQYKSESPFDKLTGNLLREEYDAEVALLPGVGYGISLNGDISSENLYKLLPHPSKIVTLTMTGEQLKSALEQTAQNLNPQNTLDLVGGLLQSSGIDYEMDLTKPVGQRVTNINIGGSPLKDSQDYRVVTHTGMLRGIHKYKEIGKGDNILKTDRQLNEFILEKFRKLGSINFPKNMGEIKITREK